MVKKTGASQDLDSLSMLNIGDEEEELTSGEGGGSVLDGIFPTQELEADATAAVEEVVVEPTTESEATVEEPESETTDEVTEAAPAEEDFEAIINELLASQTEIDEKAQEVADKAAEGGDSELQTLVSELQTMLAEKNSDIQQYKKDAEVWQKRYMDKYGEDVDLSVYKPEIETMDVNPKLRALVKFRNNPNEKVANRLTQILADLFYEKTGTDISEVLDKKDRDAAAAVLNNGPSEGQMAPEPIVEEEPELDREQSTSSILGF